MNIAPWSSGQGWEALDLQTQVRNHPFLKRKRGRKELAIPFWELPDIVPNPFGFGNCSGRESKPLGRETLVSLPRVRIAPGAPITFTKPRKLIQIHFFSGTSSVEVSKSSNVLSPKNFLLAAFMVPLTPSV